MHGLKKVKVAMFQLQGTFEVGVPHQTIDAAGIARTETARSIKKECSRVAILTNRALHHVPVRAVTVL